VTSLLKTLLSKLDEVDTQPDVRRSLMNQLLETWGIDSDEDKLHIQSLDGGDCSLLTREILYSFPETILNRAEASKYSLQSPLPEGLSGPAQNQEIDKTNLLAVASVHGQPQGEILQAIHSHGPQWAEYFRYALTRNGLLKEDYLILTRHYNNVTLLSKVSVVKKPQEVGWLPCTMRIAVGNICVYNDGV